MVLVFILKHIQLLRPNDLSDQPCFLQLSAIPVTVCKFISVVEVGCALSQDWVVFAHCVECHRHMSSQPLSWPRLCHLAPSQSLCNSVGSSPRSSYPRVPSQPLFSHVTCSCHSHVQNQIRHWMKIFILPSHILPILNQVQVFFFFFFIIALNQMKKITKWICMMSNNFPNLNQMPKSLAFLINSTLKKQLFLLCSLLFKNWPIGSEETQETVTECSSGTVWIKWHLLHLSLT